MATAVLRTIALNSDLADHVKSVTLVYTAGVVRPIFDALVDKCSKVERFHAVDCHAKRYLSQTLESGFRWVEILQNAACQLSTSPENRFARLRQLSIRSQGLSLSDLYPVFRMTSLEIVEMWLCDSPDPIKTWDVSTPKSNIKALQIDGYISSKAMKQILLSVKALRSFSHNYNTESWDLLATTDNVRARFAYFSYGELAKGLARHKHSLEEVVIGELESDESVALSKSYKPTTDGLCSLHDFEQLDFIVVPLKALINHECSLVSQVPQAWRYINTFMTPDDFDAPQYTAALLSLCDGGAKREGRTLNITIPTTAPFTELHLSRVMEALSEAGIVMAVYADRRDPYTIESIEDLRTVERYAYEHAESDDDDEEMGPFIDDYDVDEEDGEEWVYPDDGWGENYVQLDDI